ncbi:hypothetical protein AB5I39_09455 [Sphingomonas sp. MMS24-J45]|uniref:hypothetical protein n=1 Tax=Sphingomonas sp. MMS24-J45 TaxID=3238806 RepID=UPI00384EE2B9
MRLAALIAAGTIAGLLFEWLTATTGEAMISLILLLLVPLHLLPLALPKRVIR